MIAFFAGVVVGAIAAVVVIAALIFRAMFKRATTWG